MKNDHLSSEVEDMTEDEFLDSLDIEDFVFVIDREGSLKNVILPENYDTMEIPEAVQTILQMYGLNVWHLNSIH
jgi:hypothetical protein